MSRTSLLLTFSLLLSGPALADVPPQDLRAAEGLAQISAGNPAQAAMLFRKLLDEDPHRLDARDGLVRALLAMGDTEIAARETDARLALTPDDKGFARWRLTVLGLAATRRDEAILGLQGWVVENPEDYGAWRDLALYLSWSEGRLGEAIDAWRKAVAIRPTFEARLGLARTLAWSGANAESRSLFDALVAEDPKSVDALLGRSQLARWTGDQHTARVMLERAEALVEDDPRLDAERARLELDSGRYGVAKGAAYGAIEASPRLYEAHEAIDAYEAATAPGGTVRFTGTDETTGVRRLGVAIPVDFRVLPDTRLRIEPGYARFLGHGGPVETTADRLTIGLDVRQTGLPAGLYARGAYRLGVLLDGGVTHGAEVEAGAVKPLDLPASLRIGVRQRPLVDAPTDERERIPLDIVGSGGATMEGLSDGVLVREGYAGLTLAPIAGLYAYGDAAVGSADTVGGGENGRRTVSAGLGQDVLRLLPTPSAHAITVRYDLYWLSVDAPDPRYFSPTSHLAHTPGLAWQWSPGVVTVGLEGGVPLRADAPVGWLAGGFAAVRLGEHLDVAARVKATDDTAWRAMGAMVSASGRF